MSEKWHDDHKKAIAEKWTQCPPVTVKVKELISGQVCMGTYGLVELEVMQLERELAEARADAEHWKSECNALQRMVHEARTEIERKNELIEQMREALLLFTEGAIHDFHYVCQHRDNCLCLACQKVRVKAALAAERASSGK